MLEFLSASVPIEKSFFVIPRFTGNYVGCWPYAKRSFFRSLLFTASLIVVATGGLLETFYGITHMTDLVHCLEALCPGITKVVSILKMTSMFAFSKDYLKIIERMRQMLLRGTNKTRLESVQGLASLASKLSFLLFVSGNMTNLCFVSMPLINGAYRVFVKNQEFPLVLPFLLSIHKKMFEFLSRFAPIEKSFFFIPRLAGSYVGCWPEDLKRSKMIRILFWCNLTFVALGGLLEIAYGCIHISDLLNALQAFCPGITKAISTFKILSFFIYTSDYVLIVIRMRNLLREGVSRKRLSIIRNFMSMANKLSFFVFVAGNLTNFSFCISPLLNGAYRVFVEHKDYPYDLPFKLLIPDMFREMPLYPYTFLFLTLSGAMTVGSFCVGDGFFVCACLYTAAMFRVLQNDILEIFHEELHDCEIANAEQNERLRRKLSTIVKRHNEIIDLCSDFISEYTLIILMHFLSAALVLCASLLNFMLNFGNIGMFTYVSYSTAALTQLFLYCYGGNYVSQTSLEVADALYKVEWYKCDIYTRRMILMMLRRAQKAKTVAVPFFTPSLMAFSSILSTTGSYIALLKTFL